MADDPVVIAAREELAQDAYKRLHAMGGDAAQAAIDIGVVQRDRELHHFEMEQENERLTAENERLKRELLATNNYAILRKGNGWDAEFTLIHWDEEEMIWTEVEDRISRGAAVVLRDTYNARINP